MPEVVPTPVALNPPSLLPDYLAAEPDVDSIVASLSLHAKVAQLIMPWLAGSYAAFDSDAFAQAKEWVEVHKVGGIIVSVGSPLDVAAKLNELQHNSDLPLLIAADLEWGAGMRLVGGTAFPMPMALGATGRELDAYEVGRVTAIEARAVGIHMTFSPVADLNNNPDNPIINTRSFGEDPDAVATLIAAYVRGAEEHGLFTTAKHFPGHGDTGIDSHISIPATAACWERLNDVELVPFRRAIEAGVTAVMTAHISVPCLHAQQSIPATLSRTLMTDVLRDSLGFDGLVITDALIMGAIINEYGANEAVLRAFEAGSDLLLMPADVGAAIGAMVDAIESGRLDEGRLDTSVRRVIELKIAAGLFTRRRVSLDELPRVVGSAQFQQLADDIAARALTLVQQGPLDSFRADSARMALITYAEETNLTVGNTLLGQLRATGYAVRPFRLYPSSGAASYDSARTVAVEEDVVVFASSVRPIAWLGHVALPDSLAALILEADSMKPTLLASFGSPYLLNQLQGFGGTLLLAWSDNLATERAVAAAISGTIPIGGRSPIQINDDMRRGHGVTIDAVR